MQEVSDLWDDLVMHLSDSRVHNEQDAIVNKTAESELVRDCTLRARFLFIAKVSRIGEYSLCSMMARGCLY